MKTLHQCPYSEATKCTLENRCHECEMYSVYLSKKEKLNTAAPELLKACQSVLELECIKNSHIATSILQKAISKALN